MALVSCLVVVGAAVLLSVVCCLLFAVCCLLAVVSCLLSAVCCLLFAVCCLLSARCRQLFACCRPAAVGRKIKYRFHAWQAPEVFSERQPLIFSHYLCLCGSFFSSRICGIYVRPPSVFLPSAIRKVPGETAFLHHFLIPFPQRQHFPRFGAVAVPRSGRCRPKRLFSTTFSNSL